jgi:prophage antirepressor-like protein
LIPDINNKNTTLKLKKNKGDNTMNNNLKLITTETFGELQCNFYRNINNNILLTREQIGAALEYANPSKAIQTIHLKHKDRIEILCTRIIDTRHPQNGGSGVDVETVYYTERGIMEICRWSRQPKANEFMDWVWNIIEAYRNNELTLKSPQIDIQPITDAISSMSQAITTLTQNMAAIQENIQELKQAQRNRYITEKRYPSTWYKKMAPKYKMLMEYFECSRSELYSSIYKELEDTYDIDINQIYEDYCYENHLLKEECYQMDAIEHNLKLRDALTLLIDSSLVKYGIQTEDEVKNFKRETLFDREPVTN